MKLLAIIAALGLGAGVAMADLTEGLWQMQAYEGSFALVQITPCKADFCGTIIRTFKGKDEYKSPNIGKQIVFGITPQGGGAYKVQMRHEGFDVARGTLARLMTVFLPYSLEIFQIFLSYSLSLLVGFDLVEAAHGRRVAAGGCRM